MGSREHVSRTRSAIHDQMLTEDTTRVMGRLKAVFRGQAVSCAGTKLYARRHRDGYLKQLGTAGLRRRAECLYQSQGATHLQDRMPDCFLMCMKLHVFLRKSISLGGHFSGRRLWTFRKLKARLGSLEASRKPPHVTR